MRLKISKEEKKIQFIYLLSLWILMAVLFCYVCFYNSSYDGIRDVRVKELMIEEIGKKNAILKNQSQSVARIDSLNAWVIAYQATNSKVGLTDKITTELEMLRKIYESKKMDLDYKVFYQLSVFFKMPFTDKNDTWTTVINTGYVKNQLDDCRLGLTNKQVDVRMKNIIDSQNNKK